MTFCMMIVVLQYQQQIFKIGLGVMLDFCSEKGKKDQFRYSLCEFVRQGGESLDLQLMQNLLWAFRGDNSEIKSQIAFAYFSHSLQILDNQPWLYILKQMILIDKLVEENLFLEEINQLSTFWIRKKTNNTASQENSSNATPFLQRIWRIIKNKTEIMLKGSSIFSLKRSQRQLFLRKIAAKQILSQITTIEEHMREIFDFISVLSCSVINKTSDSLKRQSTSKPSTSNIYSYLLIQMLYKLLGCYNCQNICHQQLIKAIHTLSNQQKQKFKICMLKFIQNCHIFISFINKYKSIKGFQIVQSQEIDTCFIQQAIKIIDLFISENNEETYVPIIKLPFQYIPMKVETNPLHQSTRFIASLASRIKISQKYKSPNLKNMMANHSYEDCQNNVFDNWQNSFSSEFPQKQIMTVDLIVQLKLQKTEQRIRSQQPANDFLINEQRPYISFLCQNLRSTNATSNCSTYAKLFTFKQQPNSNQPLFFHNLYSQNAHQWNS